MTVDIRAKIYCDLGEVISGGFSDDHVQGTGLIRTRGDLVIKGLVKPSYGQLVQLGWKRGTVFSRVPRALRVLSYFADPFRRTTTIQLGCKFTLYENAAPGAEKDRYFYSKEDDNNKALPCTVYDTGLLPISAGNIAAKCLYALGISGTTGLTNYYAADKFDLGNGYVSVLNDLLYAESKVAYLRADETLHVINLTDNPLNAKVIRAEDVIDIGAIAGGEPPVDAVGVRYSYTRYKKPEGLDANSSKEARWELAETFGALTKVKIPISTESLQLKEYYTVIYNPYQKVETTYDRFDRPIKVVTTLRSHTAAVNPTYIAQLLDAYRADPARSNNLIPQTGPVYEVTELYYDYARAAEDLEEAPGETALECLTKAQQAKTFDRDKDSQYIRTRSYRYISDLEIAGSMNILQYNFVNPTTEATEVVHPSSTANRLVEYVEQSVDTIVVEELAGRTEATGTGINVLKNQTVYNRQTTVTKRSRVFDQTQQQLFADRSVLVDTAQALVDEINFAAELFSKDTAVEQTSSKEYNVNRRPSASEASDARNKKGIRNAEDTTEVVFVTGSENSNNSRIYDLPLAPDDRISYLGGGIPGSWSVTASDARVKAVNFARSQNRLNLGHRYGFSLQLTAETIPPYPLDGLAVEASGALALFLANGISWAFDSNGIVCNTDAVYWAGLGNTDPGYQIWFQVQPGISLLPSVTPSTNPSPSPVNSAAVASNFDPNTGISSEIDYALITDAVSTTSDWGSITVAPATPYIDWNSDLDGWSTIPYDTLPVYAEYLNNYTVIPGYLEKTDQVFPVSLIAETSRILSSKTEVDLDAMVVKLEITIPVIKPTITAPVIVEATIDTTFFDYVTVVRIEATVTATFEEAEGMLFGYVLL